MTSDLGPVLSLFTDRLREHLPGSEAGVREVLARCCRDGLSLQAADVEVEAPWGLKRLDVRISEPKSVIELKYHRPIPSGKSRPMTMQYGQLLADVRKLATVDDGSDRILVLLTDDAGMTHLRNKDLLPAAVVGRRVVREPHVLGLAQSAVGPATADGPWIDVEVSIVHRASRIGSEGLELLTWRIDLV